MKARLPQGMGGGGPSNLNHMIKQAQKAQDAMAVKQEELEQKEYTASSGGGVVKVTMSGKKELTSLEIKPEAIDPEEADLLQDMVMAAVNEAIRAVEEDSSREMGKITGGLNFGM